MLNHDAASHLQEARDYMRSISNHGLDVSALYIAQAYLTVLLPHSEIANITEAHLYLACSFRSGRPDINCKALQEGSYRCAFF